ncbi:MAG: tRNA pseudouridine(55) synthase TruB [Candidatus Pacebacteria bacterium]|nr:tRNA pseudouridine(55) synthase TruB [Candidatus Paceibacterota bacterium]
MLFLWLIIIFLAVVFAALLLIVGRTIAYIIPMLNGPVFVPSADDKLATMLKLAELKKGDRVLDLGAGDGKVVIAAANQGAEVLGVEINPLLVKKAQERIKESGLTNKAQVIRKSMWDLDLAGFDKIFIYATTYVMPRLEEKIITQAQPSARIVSNYFKLPNLPPIQTKNQVRLYQLRPTVLAINKPKGPTSHDVINQLRRVTGVKKIGHAGTLDPLAEGVLVVGITRSGTRQLKHLTKTEKKYQAQLKLGFISQTDDAQGPVEPYDTRKKFENQADQPSLKQVQQAVNRFVGWQWQIPPRHSAALIRGQRAHRLARAGKKFKVPPTRIEIKQIKVVNYSWPWLELEIVTGSGAYIRSLARDLGQELQTGAYLTKLVRTKVGRFELSDSLNVEQFEQLWQAGEQRFQ